MSVRFRAEPPRNERNTQRLFAIFSQTKQKTNPVTFYIFLVANNRNISVPAVSFYR